MQKKQKFYIDFWFGEKAVELSKWLVCDTIKEVRSKIEGIRFCFPMVLEDNVLDLSVVLAPYGYDDDTRIQIISKGDKFEYWNKALNLACDLQKAYELKEEEEDFLLMSGKRKWNKKTNY